MEMRSDVLGHATHVAYLHTLVNEHRVPAAVLLAGPPMTGKTVILERMARELLCVSGRACGSCDSCRMALTVHPDVFRFVAEEETKLRDTIATLLRRIHERPSFAPHLIVFLENVDRYSPAAVALLLKAIEDAPAYVKFLLTAENIERVPATIRSRTLFRSLQPLSTEELVKALVARGASPDEGRALAVLSGGRPGLALRLQNDSELRNRYARWHAVLGRLDAVPLLERTALAAECDERETAEELVLLFHGMLRDRIRARAFPRAGKSVSPLLAALRRSREALAMLRANVTPRLALEYVFFLPALP